MSVDSLLQFLSTRGWESASPSEVTDLLGSARRELEEEDPEHKDARVERLRRLEEGSPTPEDLMRLAMDWFPLEREVEIRELKPALMTLAGKLDEEQWETNLYWAISDAILAFKEGDRDQLFATTARIRDLLTTSWDAFAKASDAVEGTTAEAELGQRVLEESFTLFHSALDEMEDAADGDGSFGQALRCAEMASRRMMAVSTLNKKVLEMAPSAEAP